MYFIGNFTYSIYHIRIKAEVKFPLLLHSWYNIFT